MVLYSIVDVADVLYEEQGNTKPCIRKINGGFIELQSNGATADSGRVKRLYSTDPALYLDKRYYPF